MSTRVLTDFDLLLPASLEEALDILERERSAVTVLSGGTDLLVAMKAGFQDRQGDESGATARPGFPGLRQWFRFVNGALNHHRPDRGFCGRQTALPRAVAGRQNFATPQLRNTDDGGGQPVARFASRRCTRGRFGAGVPW